MIIFYCFSILYCGIFCVFLDFCWNIYKFVINIRHIKQKIMRYIIIDSFRYEIEYIFEIIIFIIDSFRYEIE